jgi:CRP-like cAMP-binding protein
MWHLDSYALSVELSERDWLRDEPPLLMRRNLTSRFSLNCKCKLSTGGRVVGLPEQLKPRFLSRLSAFAVTSVLSVAKHRRFTASSVAVHHGDPAERLFLLTSGHGRKFVMTTHGRKIPLHWLTVGQLFGGAAILATPTQYLASTELLSDSCALQWDRQTIRKLVCRWPELLDNALSISVTEDIEWLRSAHVSLTCDDARKRIARFLLGVAYSIGNVAADGVELPIKNEDVAAGANVTSFTASRALSRWQRTGVLAKRRGKVVLRKPELLFDSD